MFPKTKTSANKCVKGKGDPGPGEWGIMNNNVKTMSEQCTNKVQSVCVVVACSHLSGGGGCGKVCKKCGKHKQEGTRREENPCNALEEGEGAEAAKPQT